MRHVAVIPARLESTRLPRKVLADVDGRPVLWHVWSRVRQASQLDEVFVATDALEIATAVEEWGGRALMTDSRCSCGTERISSVVDRLQADFVVNVQGDEPLVDIEIVNRLVEQSFTCKADVITPVFRIRRVADLYRSSLVKVVRTRDQRALYFSRSPIPYDRGAPTKHRVREHPYWGHVGMYGFRSEVLREFARLPIGLLEAAEQLEQLRFLEAGFQIHTFEVPHCVPSVDTPSDLEEVRRLARNARGEGRFAGRGVPAENHVQPTPSDRGARGIPKGLYREENASAEISHPQQ